MPAVVPLIIAGVSAGTELYAANKQANAAQSAANTQAQYGNQALGLQRQAFQQQQQNLSPYLQAGSQALGNLPRLSQPPPFIPPNFNGGGLPAPQMTQPGAPSWNTPWQGPK